MMSKFVNMLDNKPGQTIAIIVAFVVFLMALTFLLNGWLLMLILGAFGVNWGFWPSLGVATAGTLLLGSFTK